MHDLLPWPNAEKHFVLSKHAISDPSGLPNSRKRPKTSFLALFCIDYANYAYLINYAWAITMAKCWETFFTIIICNMRSIRGPKLQKTAKNLIFGIIYINYAYLINYAWPHTMVKCWGTLSTIVICNMRSIRGPKVKKIAKTHFHE